jgi:ferrous iron transport protein B
MNSQETPHPLIVLVGQPNCGKSTLFNTVAGYRSISTNFPGTTVNFTRTHVRFQEHTFDLVDLPGAYSLLSLDQAEETTKKFLYTQKVDLIINVADASALCRSLELTLQLLEFNIPVILCLNMMDEAIRKGIEIDIPLLTSILQVPVIATVASKGEGIKELFSQALPMIIKGDENSPPFQNDTRIPSIDDDALIPERHRKATAIYDKVIHIENPRLSRRDKLDDILMHPLYGYLIMLGFLLLFFVIIFKLGAVFEKPLLAWVQQVLYDLRDYFQQDTLKYQVIHGSLQGIGGGIAIVLPYLIPFLIGMAILEDTGYLSRIAFLMDGLMHKIGMHGTAVLPLLLGYGCSVPAIMATRIMNSPRDRFIASVSAILLPCSARMTVIFGLVGYYLGGAMAFGFYLYNLIVIAIVGIVLSKLMPEDVPGMILEIPEYQKPHAKVILAKTWMRLKDFVIIAWPLLIIGSLVLSLAEWFQVDHLFNSALRPITWILGLPSAIGTTLIFGILRKELSMLMLLQALHTTDVSQVLSPTQMAVFTAFVMFYFPCLATLGIMSKEIGWQKTLLASVITTLIALIVALQFRWLGSVI